MILFIREQEWNTTETNVTTRERRQQHQQVLIVYRLLINVTLFH